MNGLSSTAQRPKRALITGVTGQDGSYLARFLLNKGYEVHGIVRRASLFNTDRIDELYHDPHVGGAKLTLHYGDLADGSALRHVLEGVAPDEVYNLGAQSHVRVSSTSLNTLPTSMLWARSGCSRPCVIMFANADSKFAIIKPGPLKCSGRRRHPRAS